MNPILQKLQPQNNLGGIKQMMNMIQSAQNPQAMMMQMIQMHPRVKEAMDYMKAFRSPEAAFNAMARKKGVDPNAFMSDLLNELK